MSDIGDQFIFCLFRLLLGLQSLRQVPAHFIDRVGDLRKLILSFYRNLFLKVSGLHLFHAVYNLSDIGDKVVRDQYKIHDQQKNRKNENDQDIQRYRAG